MNKSVENRKNQGTLIVDECIVEIDNAFKNLLASIEGFRRDTDLAKKSDSPIEVTIETKRIFIPPPKTNTGYFSGMVDTLSRTLKAFEGEIKLGSGWQDNQSIREKSWTELYLIHENLSYVGASARMLYNSLEKTSRIFHEFNGGNDEAHLEANISFEEDYLNLSIALARVFIEHSVRLDIEVMELVEKVRSDDETASI